MKKPQTLFLAWQDTDSRSWFTIGKLTYDGKEYQFVYTQGVKEAENQCQFQPLYSFPDFHKV
ncbi:MAG: DNA-binding protein, partial [Sphaerospermopsis kisseleviana]